MWCNPKLSHYGKFLIYSIDSSFHTSIIPISWFGIPLIGSPYKLYIWTVFTSISISGVFWPMTVVVKRRIDSVIQLFLNDKPTLFYFNEGVILIPHLRSFIMCSNLKMLVNRYVFNLYKVVYRMKLR